MIAHSPNNSLEFLDVALALETRRHRGAQIVENADGAIQLQKAGALNNGLLRDGGKLLPDIVDNPNPICIAAMVDARQRGGGMS